MIWTGASLVGTRCLSSLAAESNIAPQPYFASVNRALEALANLGSPISTADGERISALARLGNKGAVEEAETILDRYTVARIETTGDGYARTQVGGAPKTLIEQGWSVFLVRVSNPVGATTRLALTGDHTSPTSPSTGAGRTGIPDTVNAAPGIALAWFRSELYVAPPMAATLSGATVEYQIVQLFSRDRGLHETDIDFFFWNRDGCGDCSICPMGGSGISSRRSF